MRNHFICARAFRDNFDIDGNVKVNLNFKSVDNIIADHLFNRLFISKTTHQTGILLKIKLIIYTV